MCHFETKSIISFHHQLKLIRILHKSQTKF